MELENYKFYEGDQIKIKVELVKEAFYKWDLMKKNIKEFCKDKKIYLASIELTPKKETQRHEKEQKVEKETNTDVLHRFCKQENLDDKFIKVAEEILCL
jgi:hypothetical protein